VRAKLPGGAVEERTITVQAGEGTSANFEAAATAAIQSVTVTGRASRIDLKSPESTAFQWRVT
jgi:hypothetical protein